LEENFWGEKELIMDKFWKIMGTAAGVVIGYVIVTGAINFIRGSDKLKEFVPYHSEEGRFSVKFPGEPKRELKTLDTPEGKIDLVMFSAGTKKEVFVAGYSDYPESMIKKSSPEALLNGGRDGAVLKVKGRLVDEKDFDFYGYKAKEIKIEVPKKAIIRQRMIQAGNRFYQVVVVCPLEDNIDNKSAEFFDSFRIDKTPSKDVNSP
jgi:hypothetical protein